MASVNRRLRIVANEGDTVELRLKRAFPEIDLEKLVNRSSVLNAHNVAEKWDATVRQVQWWIDTINS